MSKNAVDTMSPTRKAAQSKACPTCHHTHLLRIGVPGIRKCAHCNKFVDLRRKSWWQRLTSA